MEGLEMRAEELMIGNWVWNSHNQKAEQVMEIRETGVMLDYNDIYDYDEIEAIQLTAEILNRNGFERISKSPYKTEYRLCFDEDNNDFLFVDIHHLRNYVTVYYNPLNRMVHLDCNIDNCMVHELQHALKLCGIDKQIVL